MITSSNQNRVYIFITACCLYGCAVAHSQDDLLDDFPTPGLIGTYVDSAGNKCTRVDSRLSFDWGSGPADPRLKSGSFQVHWTGQLLVRSSGQYTFYAESSGSLAIKIGSTQALNSAAGTWIRSKPVDLQAGMKDLDVVFQHDAGPAAMRLFWSGPGFGIEPVNPTNTLHYREDAPEPLFERGHQLFESLRCATCHNLDGVEPAMDAPALDRLTGNLHPLWLRNHLSDPAATVEIGRRMPHFPLNDEQSKAITAYLFSLSADRAAKPLKPLKQSKKKGVPANPGERLFVSVGCLSCHEFGDLGTSDLFGGSPLTALGEKRPKGFVRRWLTDPAAINSVHRMPKFSLNEQERSDLAKYLESVAPSREFGNRDRSWLTDASLIQSGAELVKTHRCRACHKIDSAAENSPKIALTRQTQWTESCLSDVAAKHPSYLMNEQDQEALKNYVMAVASAGSSEESSLTGKDLLRRSNCLACHRREVADGNAKVALSIANKYSDAISHIAELTPPSLNSIGDKFESDSLRKAIRGDADRRRPWLHVRMPKFRFSDQEAKTLGEWFVQQDRVPRDAKASAARLSDEVLLTVGPRLVTSNGFGCASCHAIGNVVPAKAPPNARGPNLAGIGKNIRKEWFDRWVADPLRVVPRVEMPAIKVPVSGVLANDLDQQINAVWHVLNLEGFRPPKPDPVRVVRHYGDDPSAQSHVLTDVLRVGETTFIKPLVVGLANRHNVLFNLEENRLEGWWLGDVAAQHTRGKVWYWESAGANLLSAVGSESDFKLVRDDSGDATTRSPIRQGQFLTELDGWQHASDGLIVRHRLHFDDDQTVHVTQQFTPVTTDGNTRSGWLRKISVRGIPKGWNVQMRVLPSAMKPRLSGSRFTVQGAAQMSVQVDGDGTAQPDGSIVARGSASTIELIYTTALPVDQIPRVTTEEPVRKVVPMDIVPGFVAEQLALPSDILPTGFSWRGDGVLFLCDLKGRVYQTSDDDGDGMPEQAAMLSDELATPFGLKAHDRYVDVINKYALLRLHDEDGDQHAERVETLVSGWGHTTDYHDWAIGLPQTEDGKYLAAFACQQDDRSAAAADYRGNVVELVPRKPTDDNPHRYDIRVLTAGHRFPIGIARNKDGDVFVPDNQGNYNPFNELNHVVAGKRYGFLNKLERKPGFNPPLTAPAIDIPHPWTRSVNGICFLETPESADGSAFGPFEGHLVGCEYDTRRLIRMSLQRVDGIMQGAAYPLSYDQPPSGPPLLGPITCAVSPTGDLFIGNIRESGWGAGQNTGNVVRLRLNPETLPTGIAEIEVSRNGFVISFTGDVSSRLASDRGNYSIESYTRQSTPKYGGDDQYRRTEEIGDVLFDAANNAVTIKLSEELRENFVYEFNLRKLIEGNEQFFPSRAFYTLRRKP